MNEEQVPKTKKRTYTTKANRGKLANGDDPNAVPGQTPAPRAKRKRAASNGVNANNNSLIGNYNPTVVAKNPFDDETPAQIQYAYQQNNNNQYLSPALAPQLQQHQPHHVHQQQQHVLQQGQPPISGHVQPQYHQNHQQQSHHMSAHHPHQAMSPSLQQSNYPISPHPANQSAPPPVPHPNHPNQYNHQQHHQPINQSHANPIGPTPTHSMMTNGTAHYQSNQQQMHIPNGNYPPPPPPPPHSQQPHPPPPAAMHQQPMSISGQPYHHPPPPPPPPHQLHHQQHPGPQQPFLPQHQQQQVEPHAYGTSPHAPLAQPPLPSLPPNHHVQHQHQHQMNPSRITSPGPAMPTMSTHQMASPSPYGVNAGSGGMVISCPGSVRPPPPTHQQGHGPAPGRGPVGPGYSNNSSPVSSLNQQVAPLSRPNSQQAHGIIQQPPRVPSHLSTPPVHSVEATPSPAPTGPSPHPPQSQHQYSDPYNPASSSYTPPPHPGQHHQTIKQQMNPPNQHNQMIPPSPLHPQHHPQQHGMQMAPNMPNQYLSSPYEPPQHQTQPPPHPPTHQHQHQQPPPPHQGPQDSYCPECRRQFYIEDFRIMCRPGCGAYYHQACSGLTEFAYNLLMRESNAEWVCQRCIDSDQKIPFVRTIVGQTNDCRAPSMQLA